MDLPNLADLFSANRSARSCHQLIFIGNGFDRACELASSYGDFFGKRLNIIKHMNTDKQSDWERIVTDSELTIWDFILKESSGSDWCNVEKAISEWILYRDDVQYDNSLLGLVESVVNELTFFRNDGEAYNRFLYYRFHDAKQVVTTGQPSILIDDIISYLAFDGKVRYDCHDSKISFISENYKVLKYFKSPLEETYALVTKESNQISLTPEKVGLVISLSRYLQYKRKSLAPMYDRKSILSVLRSDLTIIET